MTSFSGTPKSRTSHHPLITMSLGRSRVLSVLLLVAAWWQPATWHRTAFVTGPLGRSRRMAAVQMRGVKGYFAIRDLLVVQRNKGDVAAFHESEKKRWRKVYDEEYVETPQDFYPGDRVEVISDVSVNKDIKNAEGMRGVVTHFDFDDGYESCQTCQSSYPVTVLLDDP
eukprot:s1865_g27.t1